MFFFWGGGGRGCVLVCLCVGVCMVGCVWVWVVFIILPRQRPMRFVVLDIQHIVFRVFSIPAVNRIWTWERNVSSRGFTVLKCLL